MNKYSNILFKKKYIKIDLINLILIVLVLSSLGYLLFNYYKENINDCTRNPLTYGAKQIEDLYATDSEFFGTGVILGHPETYFTFNSRNLTFNKKLG